MRALDLGLRAIMSCAEHHTRHPAPEHHDVWITVCPKCEGREAAGPVTYDDRPCAPLHHTLCIQFAPEAWALTIAWRCVECGYKGNTVLVIN